MTDRQEQAPSGQPAEQPWHSSRKLRRAIGDFRTSSPGAKPRRALEHRARGIPRGHTRRRHQRSGQEQPARQVDRGQVESIAGSSIQSRPAPHLLTSTPSFYPPPASALGRSRPATPPTRRSTSYSQLVMTRLRSILATASGWTGSTPISWVRSPGELAWRSRSTLPWPHSWATPSTAGASTIWRSGCSTTLPGSPWRAVRRRS